jgi:hypothetical protein
LARAGWRIGNGSAAIAYSLQSVQTDAQGYQSKYELAQPVHRFQAVFAWLGPGGLESGVQAAWLRPPDQVGYWLVEASAGTTLLSGVRIFAKLLNALNVSYSEVPGAPQPGRYFLAGMEWAFETSEKSGCP